MFLVNHPYTLNQKYLSYILLLLNMAPILSPTWFSLIVFLFFTALPGALLGCHRRRTFISQTVGLMLQLFSFFVIIMFICHATHHLVVVGFSKRRILRRNWVRSSTRSSQMMCKITRRIKDQKNNISKFAHKEHCCEAILLRSFLASHHGAFYYQEVYVLCGATANCN